MAWSVITPTGTAYSNLSPLSTIRRGFGASHFGREHYGHLVWDPVVPGATAWGGVAPTAASYAAISPGAPTWTPIVPT